MKIGIIGLGVVGGTLKRWLENHTTHEIRAYDPPLGLKDSLLGCEFIFVSVPVPANSQGQDLRILTEAVRLAKSYTRNVFIRSTVLPGTNDALDTFAMPEFLTERQAYKDFCELPIIVGGGGFSPRNLEEVFPGKTIHRITNAEAELAKFTHNCFGAMKVTYFNIVEELCRKFSADYPQVLSAAMTTGFIEPTHTLVPGPDGKRGYGGKCFPENMAALEAFLGARDDLGMQAARVFFEAIQALNWDYRHDKHGASATAAIVDQHGYRPAACELKKESEELAKQAVGEGLGAALT